ncbi:pentapeptide repeat-containing protein [Streptomyces sp. N2A]|uniref:pentapeptide repeat-containing protein n=1 Tax=Streptomyces sp. N2A TaxID=3073936 RepID=UPI00287045D6|nr:pentapeptide repeat-containing protein [Streptomyces sp. N2A]
MQVGQTSKELHIAEQGQITNRFNAAIGNLGSQSLDIRLGGIYALQRIMQDSARDHPTVVSVLAAFAQRHAGPSAKSLKEPVDVGADVHAPKADVGAAIATLGKRRPDRDSGTVVDLSKTDLRGLRLTYPGTIRFPGADLSDTDLRWAFLDGADFRKANFLYSNLENSSLRKVNLRGAHLAGAKLAVVSLDGADLRQADLTCASAVADPETGKSQSTDCVVLQYAILDGSDLRKAKMTHADLRNADLKGADLRGADLTRSDLTNADLTNADFRGAKLTGVKLKGTKQSGALGIPREG